jgi:methyltransferase OMS1
LAKDTNGDSRDELLFGHRLMRRWMMKHAKGDVLEVSAGTARNIPYYKSSQIKSLTLTDSSDKMMEIARAKNNLAIPVHFHTVDAHSLPAPDDTFDTVVSTFGLCSCENPVDELREMARVVKPSGQLLLLEHGKGKYQFLNDALDKTSADHAKRWGCWWNRQVESIVTEAGLKVDYIKRWHLGTTYYILASKPSSPPTE